MHQLIEKIALECGAWHQVYDQKRFMINENFDVDKFAELIVRECADIATINQYSHYTAGHYVLKHFGVE